VRSVTCAPADARLLGPTRADCEAQRKADGLEVQPEPEPAEADKEGKEGKLAPPKAFSYAANAYAADGTTKADPPDIEVTVETLNFLARSLSLYLFLSRSLSLSPLARVGVPPCWMQTHADNHGVCLTAVYAKPMHGVCLTNARCVLNQCSSSDCRSSLPSNPEPLPPPTFAFTATTTHLRLHRHHRYYYDHHHRTAATTPRPNRCRRKC
jgi:hypothetical protein